MDTLESEITTAAKAAINKAIVDSLVGYNGPLLKLCQKAIDAHERELYALINEEVASLVGARDFRVELKAALNAKLARTLIDRMGGEIEKRVNELKSDPTTRAKITLAIQKVIDELS